MADLVKRPDAAPVAWSDPTATANPLKLLPAAVRADVGKLWMCNAHLFPSALPLCSTIRVYLDTCPLEPADLAAVCEVLLRPERRERHRFASDLLCDLSGMCAALVREKRKAGEREAVAARFAEWEKQAVSAADIFKPVG